MRGLCTSLLVGVDKWNQSNVEPVERSHRAARQKDSGEWEHAGKEQHKGGKCYLIQAVIHGRKDVCSAHGAPPDALVPLDTDQTGSGGYVLLEALASE